MKVLCLAVAAAFADTAAAQALPIGGAVAHGSATIGTTGAAMTVTQTSPRAVINWNSFNVGDGASVTFAQPGATSIAVNRVTGGAGASAINGTLSANGNVMILNPNGVLFGSTATVNVGGLIASTGSINDDQFMSNPAASFVISGATNGAVSNQGAITVTGAGLAAFVAPSVSNSGLIQATGGRIALASAQEATVSLNGGLYEIAVTRGVADGTIANTGSLITGAASGSIVLSALDAANLVSGVINLEGVQQANKIEVHGGKVVLSSDLNAAKVAGSSSQVEVHAGAQIQDAVDIASAGATIDVWGGSYKEGHANVDYFGAPGGQKFGLHVYKDDLLIRGRNSAGGALTGLDDPDMPTVTAQYQTGFGAQHFVSGSGVTIEGLKFKPVSSGTNKTLEVIGNDFTLRNSVIDNSGNATAAAFYISDFAIEGKPQVESFRLENNRFIAGTTASALVVVGSGAGNDTDASNRIFSGNELIGTLGLSGARGFQIQGELPHVPWQISTAGAVTVLNNSFTNLDVPVRTVGELSQQLDWNSVFNGNTFVGGAALAFEGNTSTARSSMVSVAPQDGTTTPNDAPDTRITRSIQASIDRAQSGDTVRALAGTYVQSSTLNVSKSLTLVGAGPDKTVIDARGVGSYGLSVSADNVTLSDFTLYGPAANVGSAYGIKVQPAGSAASSRLHDFTITNVTSRGAGRAELDLNGVVGATIDNFTADGAPVGNDAGTTAGAGIQITDSADVTITGSETRNNAWGGVAIYQANRFFDQQTTGIVVQADNTFNEANPLYLQDESSTRNFGTLALHGFDYAVRNSDAASHNDQYTWLQYTLNGAVDFAVNLTTPAQSYVQEWNVSAPTQNFHVGVGNLMGGGTRAMSIAKAVAAADSGASIQVGAGNYAENLTIDKTLSLNGAGADHTVLQSPTAGAGTAVAINNASDVTLSDLSVKGYQYGLTLNGTSPDATVERVAFDGNTYAMRNGTTTKADNFRMLDSSITGGLIGVQTYNGVSGGNPTASFANALFRNVRIDGPSYKGFYFETADNLVLRDVTVENAGNFGGQDPSQFQKYGHAVDVNLKYAAFDSITFDNLVVRNSGRSSGDATRAAVVVKTRGVPGDSATYVAVPASLQSVNISGGSIEGSDGVGIRFEDLSNGAGGKPTVVVGGGMQFRNNGQDILVGAANVDATGAVFVDGADGFAIEDRVTHALDQAGRGRVTWQPGQLYVTQTSGSVQRAIDAASDGETVNVAAGTFSEQLILAKSLWLRGAGADHTVITSGSLAADASGMRNLLTIGGAATEAQVSGFTFKGPVPQINAGIFVRDGAYAHIHDNKLIDMRESAALSGNQRGQAIFVGRASLGTSGRATIENNEITGYQKGGIVVDGPGSQAVIKGNTVTGEGPTGVIAQNGIQASRGASATIVGNQVSGNHYTGASDEATGILIFTPGFYLGEGSINVGPNAVTGNEVGIWTNDPATLAGISLSGVSGNVRNAVADFGGGFAGQGINLEYPAWSASATALVDQAVFSGKQAGDIVGMAGGFHVSGWNGFAAIQPAIDAVAAGGTVNVTAGTYAEDVTVAGLRNLLFDGAGSTVQGFTLNSGAAWSGIGGRLTANGATGFVVDAPVFLLGDTTLATAGANIRFNGDIQGAGGNAYALSLNAGSGDVRLASGGGEGNPLGRLEVTAGNFTLLGTMWVTGYDIDALGDVALSAHTLRSAGSGFTNAIDAGGSVTGSTVADGGVQIRSSGNVAANVTSQGEVAVAAVNVSGTYAASRAVFEAQNKVSVKVDVPDAVEVRSGGSANVSGSASQIHIDAPSGSVSGDFGQVTNAGSGVIQVNGKPEVGAPLVASTENNSRIVPAEVATAANVQEARAAGGELAPLRRARPEGVADALASGEAVELDLSPSTDDE